MQLSLREIQQTQTPVAKRLSMTDALGQEQRVTFPLLVDILHQTLGGNYRALEFFDELYQQKKAEIVPTLEKLADFQAQLEKESRPEVLKGQAHDRVVRWKIGFLGAATIAYLIALVILAFVFVGTLWGGS